MSKLKNGIDAIKIRANNNISRTKSQMINQAKFIASSQEHYNKYKDIVDRHPYASKYLLYSIANAATDKKFESEGLSHSGEMLKAALNFNAHAPKIANTFIVKSYKELEPLSEFIKEKLISQNMDPETTPGIIFGVNSGICQDIAASQEVKDFANKYKIALKNKQPLSTSITFNSTYNLYSALNKADVMLAYIDSNKNLILILLDTYDFNKLENLLVELGYSAQEAKLLDLYWGLFVIKVPYGKY